MRRLCYCTGSGSTMVRSENFRDGYLVPTSVGPKRADEIQPNTPATLSVPGVDADGLVVYTAKYGGSAGNDIFVSHETGETGPGHESRPLAVSFDPDDEDGRAIVVTFGTTSGGFTMLPTAQQIADLVSAEAVLLDVVMVEAGGDGTGDAGVIDPTYLGGGADDGDWRKFNVNGGDCMRVNAVEVI